MAFADFWQCLAKSANNVGLFHWYKSSSTHQSFTPCVSCKSDILIPCGKLASGRKEVYSDNQPGCLIKKSSSWPQKSIVGPNVNTCVFLLCTRPSASSFRLLMHCLSSMPKVNSQWKSSSKFTTCLCRLSWCFFFALEAEVCGQLPFCWLFHPSLGPDHLKMPVIQSIYLLFAKPCSFLFPRSLLLASWRWGRSQGLVAAVLSVPWWILVDVSVTSNHRSLPDAFRSARIFFFDVWKRHTSACNERWCERRWSAKSCLAVYFMIPATIWALDESHFNWDLSSC